MSMPESWQLGFVKFGSSSLSILIDAMLAVIFGNALLLLAVLLATPPEVDGIDETVSMVSSMLSSSMDLLCEFRLWR